MSDETSSKGRLADLDAKIRKAEAAIHHDPSHAAPRAVAPPETKANRKIRRYFVGAWVAWGGFIFLLMVLAGPKWSLWEWVTAPFLVLGISALGGTLMFGQFKMVRSIIDLITRRREP